MTIQQELLDILCCPETKEPVALIEDEAIAKINAAIQARKARYRDGTVVEDEIESGLLREDGKYLYPIRDGIPIMLIEEAIDMATIDS
jgi:uncharacterized protein YbaR (Trm112 family)